MGMKVKPLASPESEGGTNLTIKGWRGGGKGLVSREMGMGIGTGRCWSGVLFSRTGFGICLR